MHSHVKEKQDFYLDKLKMDAEYARQPKYRYFWNRKQAINHYHNEQLDLAEGYFSEALSLAVMTENPEWMAQSYNDLGVLANNRKDFKKALKYYDKSLDINKQRNDDYQIGKLYNNIGTVYKLLEDYQTAINYHQLALETLEANNNQKDIKVEKRIRHAHESLLQLYLLTKDHKLADEYVQKILNNNTEQVIVREKIPSLINFVRVYIQGDLSITI